MPLWVRALSALADWLDRGVWDAPQGCEWVEISGDAYVLWDGWRSIRLGEGWPRWLTR